MQPHLCMTWVAVFAIFSLFVGSLAIGVGSNNDAMLPGIDGSGADRRRGLMEDRNFLKSEMVLIQARDCLQYDNKLTNTYRLSMRADGSWADINYSDTSRLTDFPPRAHIERVSKMASLWAFNESQRFQDSALLQSVKKGLDYWLLLDLQSDGWWYNQVWTPIYAGIAALSIESELTSAQLNKIHVILDRCTWRRFTGANLIWVGTGGVIQGLLRGNDSQVSEIVGAFFDSVQVEPAGRDGIKQDLQFFQHSRLLYTGGYGLGYLSASPSPIGLSNLMVLSYGTVYQPNLSKFNLLVDYIVDGVGPSILPGKTMHHTIVGRNIARPNGGNLKDYTDNLVLLSHRGYTYRRSEINALSAYIKGNASRKSLNSMYYRTDYMVHNRPNYSLSFRSFSARTRNVEFISGEGFSTAHLADGVLLRYEADNGYRSVIPLWDWNLLPGITVDYGRVSLNQTEEITKTGGSSMVGGVSDGLYGASTITHISPYTESTLRFQKTVFFFDDIYVVLVANVSASRGSDVRTVIDSRLSGGNLHYAYHDSPTVYTYSPISRANRTNLAWMYQSRELFLLPNNLTVAFIGEAKNATWRTVGTYDNAASDTLFTAFARHKAFTSGGTATQARYASLYYAVAPSVPFLADAAAISARIWTDLRVVNNTEHMQGVDYYPYGPSNKTERFVIVTFWAGSYPLVVSRARAYSIVPTSSCMIMVHHLPNKKLEITVSDPKQRLTTLSFALRGLEVSCAVCSFNASTLTTSFVIALPQGEFKGKSVTVTGTIVN